MKYIFIPAVALLVCTVISTPTSVGKIEERDPDAVNNLPSRDKKCGDDVFTPANKTKKREFLDYPIIPGDDAWSGQVQQGAYRVVFQYVDHHYHRHPSILQSRYREFLSVAKRLTYGTPTP